MITLQFFGAKEWLQRKEVDGQYGAGRVTMEEGNKYKK